MNENLEGLNFDGAVEALEGWVGRRVRIEVGARGALDDVIVLIDVRIRSVDVVLPSAHETTGTLHIPLENKANEQVACLALAESTFEEAAFYPSQELVAFASGARVIVQLADASEVAPGSEEPRWTSDQRAAAIGFLETLPWGDIETAKFDFETALFLALDATIDAASLWSELAEREGYADEFSVSPDEVAAMGETLRLAYVARLLPRECSGTGLAQRVVAKRESLGSLAICCS